MNFDWKALGEQIGKLGLPLLGGALGGPAGAAIGTALSQELFGHANATPDQIAAAVSGNADMLVKLKEYEAREKEALLNYSLAMAQEETKRLQTVNATLQADANGKGWLQQNTHAIESLGTMLLIFSLYVFMPIVKIVPPVVPAEAWMTLGALLGIRAWMKGRAEQAEATAP